MQNQTLAKKQLLEKDLNTLVGIINGISADGHINFDELAGLNNWISSVSERNHFKNYQSLLAYVQEAISDNFLSDDERDEILYQCDVYLNSSGFYQSVSKGLQLLSGFLHGIVIDNKLTEDEVKALDTWLDENDYLQGNFPYDEIYSVVTHILEDGKATEEELLQLRFAIEVFKGEDGDNAAMIEFLAEKNIYHIDPLIEFEGKGFTITGLSKRYKRSELYELLSSKGAVAKSNVSKLTNYLVVCADKNDHWAYAAYGRKIEAALRLRKSGVPLVIVHEFDLYDHFQ